MGTPFVFARLGNDLIIKFNEAEDVMTIIAKRKNLSQSSLKVLIKLDMTKEQRDTERVLLKERRSLLDTGAVRKDVKIRGNDLYVGQRLHGTANTHSFIKSPCKSW